MTDNTLAWLNKELNTSEIDVAIILGSGLGEFSNEINSATEIPYASIPDFPQSSVAGHKGSLFYGQLEGKKVLCFSGRFHHYEGFEFDQTVIPVQLAHALHAKLLFVTNAAGGINEAYKVGDLMAIRSCLKVVGMAGVASSTPFTADDQNQYKLILEEAQKLNIHLQNGHYLYTTGPNYETPAEIRFFRTIGADAVGMSTYAEIVEAAKLKLPFAAISLISNMASGMGQEKLDHSEIKEAASIRKQDLHRLIRAMIQKLDA